MLNRWSQLLLCFMLVSVKSYSFDISEKKSQLDKSITITLPEAVALGMRNSNAIKSQALLRLNDKFDLRVAQDGFRPQLVFNSKYLRSTSGNLNRHERSSGVSASLLTPLGTQLTLDWSYRREEQDMSSRQQGGNVTFALVQPLLRDAGTDVNTVALRLAEIDERMGQLRYQQQVAETITNIILAYHRLLKAQQQFELSQQALHRASAQRDVVARLINSGRVASLEQLQSDADIAEQQLRIAQEENELNASRLALCGLLGIDNRTLLSASKNLEIKKIALKTDWAVEKALQTQPDYLIQQLASQKQKFYLIQAQNQRRWDVDLVAGAERNDIRGNDMQDNGRWQRYVGLNVSIPFNDMRARQEELRAEIAQKNQRLDMADTRQQLEEAVTQQIDMLNNSWQQYVIADRLTRLSEKKLQAEQTKLAAGRSSNFQVLSYQNDLRFAQNARLNAQVDYLNVQANLDMLIGYTLSRWGVEVNGF